MNNNTVIQIENISKIYQMGKVKVPALVGINLSINKHTYTAIMGPSGSGKSTLLHILGCLDTPTEGVYYLDHETVSDLSYNKLAEIRNSKIGFVFQVFNLLPNMNILENVELPLMYAGVSKKKRKNRAKEVLEQVGLGHRLKHKPQELSGGERQRTAIARALANNPSIILADEPTGNLDSTSGSSIMKIFSDLHEQGHTIIVVTHDSNIAKMTQRVVTLRDGKVVSS
ncbi:MAG: ABC transporter ATP-binding protein [Candidatus Cloacimonetes bacterium]|nr:ABC transporter ATP-binding protein [Candidatus Cloacimonadota bacterium]